MKSYVLLESNTDTPCDIVGVISAATDDEFYSKAMLACSAHYKNNIVITRVSGKAGESWWISVDIIVGDSEWGTYLQAEEVEIY